MLAVWDELQDHFYDYYRDLPYQTWPILARSVGYLILLGCLFWPLLAAARRLQFSVLRKLICAVVLGILLVGLDVARLHGMHFYGSSLTGVLGKAGILLLAGAAGLGTLYLLLFRDRLLSGGVRRLLLFLIFLMPINLITTAWAIHTAWPLERYAGKQAPRLASTAAQPRVVWIIFDDWDEFLTFRERPAGLSLPEIDRFRAQSLHAEIAFPPAADTLESLPSLITGRIVRKSRTTAPDELLLTMADTQKREPWSQQANVFSRARQLNVNGAVAGFYHPYPRVIGPSVVESFSAAFISMDKNPVYFSGLSGFEKIRFHLWDALHRVPLIKNSGLLGGRRARRISRIDYELVHRHSLKMAVEPDLGLVLLHYPLPHPPGIYDRTRGRVTEQSKSGYVENLALTDVTLRELRQTMEAAGLWDSSFVLISSDHPLKEDARRHPWIPFLLKTPGQKTAFSYPTPFNSVLTQELILSALRGEIHTPEEAAAWLDRNRSRFPAESPAPASDNVAAAATDSTLNMGQLR